MLVRNRTDHRPVLSRGTLGERLALASITVEVVFALRGDGAWRRADEPRDVNDPPDIRRIALWKDTSVTAAGEVFGPSRPPYARGVRLSIRGQRVELAIFGPRRWERDRLGGGLRPSEPAPFERVALSWENAFGGSVELPPGYLPGTDLPFPGGTAAYPRNPVGVGWTLDPASAEGVPLPQIEHATNRIDRPDDEPWPAGLSPCPEHGVLRAEARDLHQKPWLELAEGFEHTLYLQHHAPPALIRRDVEPGSTIELEGVGDGPIAFTVPSSPLSVRFHHRRREQGEATRGRVRSVHLDAGRKLARVVYGHLAKSPASRPHRHVTVEHAKP